jgi:hypothetical protein
MSRVSSEKFNGVCIGTAWVAVRGARDTAAQILEELPE